MAADEQPTPPPQRIEGPTPGGGAYALVYLRPDGRAEIVEFDASDREIRRTYAGPRPA